MGRRFCFSLCMLMLCVCAGCSSSVVSDDVMRIDVGEALDDGRSVGLSRYGSAIEYVPLESVPQSLLRRNSRVFYDKGKFFLVASHTVGGVDVPFFDESGKYLGRVGNAGRGPGEYNNLVGFFVEYDNEADRVCILGQHNAVVYDLSGQCICEIPFDGVKELTGRHAFYSSANFDYVGGGKYCLLASAYIKGDMNEYLFVFDSSGNVIKQINVGKALKRTKTLKGVNHVSIWKSHLYFSSGQVGQTGSSRDTLFSVDCDGGTRSAKAVFTMYGKPFGKVLERNDAFSLMDILECDKFILSNVSFPTADFPDFYKIFRVVPHKANAWLLYDKEESSCTALKYNKVPVDAETSAVGVYAQFPGNDGFLNDLDGGMPFLPSYINDGKMFQLVDASVFIEMAGICSSARMKEVAAQLTEESNPVVVVVTMK